MADYGLASDEVGNWALGIGHWALGVPSNGGDGNAVSLLQNDRLSSGEEETAMPFPYHD
ncbi:MAG: hypothetical protein JGK24_09625 [Microcoleus sp. PH2017_29_MFU_D_A]|jgi:hypothetical protein|uniref:hypothetical protein n=1 Tax=unclassified Microcoleus TaxID=2642155 RepID=UPI001D389576|nr:MULTISPECIES: hypothetical protein [unclassified Microcoleus]MCC3421386.1 hypothetical protein [Microcoleus sp. PH2017_07_MST_O_A]MCC3466618.1 hypothetical protein [Microcoleus sp. PH2017_06_SFM_O_A]MCC3503714.1 hypothetical protein [Microcoleus sp. PH2017_19_SFW_U_A]MCC3513426.1 hypothetical protein [Microcoleus sp. PH2017_17_BER_D_A]MCC3412477.1 hypothetical protein [Microcoleus sp. PH2017_02_FOX_O_A]